MAVVWLLIIAAVSVHASVKLRLREGRPIVDEVYVNGHGPYTFLIDTGSNVNLIEDRLARKIGLSVSGKVEIASASGKSILEQCDGNEVTLDSAKAGGQRFLISALDALQVSMPDVKGVLGNWFLSHFDYEFDFRSGRLTFGDVPETIETNGTRVDFHVVNLRPVVSTTLGNLVLDSGHVRVVLFGVQPDPSLSKIGVRTLTSTEVVGEVYGKSLSIGEQKLWRGDAIAVPFRPEQSVDGLLPLSLFNAIYVSNSGGYLIFK